jgi:phosphoserine phosphatase
MAILVEGAGGLAATVGGFLNYAGASIFPAACVAASVLVAAALFRERVWSEQAKQRMDHELALASRIQQDLLPAGNPSVAGFDLAGWSRPSAQVGGDTYDFASLSDGRWMIALADASGHGIGPALIMCQTHATLRALAAASADPVEILRKACELLGRGLPEGRFVTCFLGVLDPPAAAILYASAGHGPIIFYDRQADRFDLQNASQPPLPLAFPDGLAGTSNLPRRPFAAGDMLVLASDGFWESTDRSGGMFGMPRLLEVLRRARDLGAAEIIDQARQDIERFTAPHKPADDLTMVVIRKR